MDETARRRREFIRAHHPDQGGDPAVFIAGLRVLDEESALPGPGSRPRVTLVAHRSWLVRLVIAMVHRMQPDKGPPRVR